MPEKDKLVSYVREVNDEHDLGIEEQVDIDLFATAIDRVAATKSQIERDTENYSDEDVNYGISIFCFPVPWTKSDDDEEDTEDDDKPKLGVRRALLQQIDSTGDLQVFIPYDIFARSPSTIFDFLIGHPNSDNAVLSIDDLLDEFEDTESALEYISEYKIE